MISGILFDKDGTLFDFQATWGNWTARVMHDLARGDDAQAARLAAAVGYDLGTGRFAPDSPIITHTPDEIADRLLALMPGAKQADLVEKMNAMSAVAPLVPATPLEPLLTALRGRGLRIGLATNDAEGSARAQLGSIGIAALFDYVAGFDSGHGGKPGPGMLLAFAKGFGLEPSRIAMVGDSRHDLIAGRAAGMHTVAVLTGLAGADELAPFADVVLPHIGHLPDWLDATAALNSAR